MCGADGHGAEQLCKRRGITIKASVVSFFVNTLKINLIDTPGHADFLAEVERSLSVLDGAILLISAVEGMQAQTKMLLMALRKLRIPTIIFINKIDRGGAQADELICCVARKVLPERVTGSRLHGAFLCTLQGSSRGKGRLPIRQKWQTTLRPRLAQENQRS